MLLCGPNLQTILQVTMVTSLCLHQKVMFPFHIRLANWTKKKLQVLQAFKNYIQISVLLQPSLAYQCKAGIENMLRI